MARRSPSQYNWRRLQFDETILKKHFTAPRRSKIKFVVVHHMTIVGNGKGRANDACYRVWQTRQASAHYGVDGKHVRQFVWDRNAGWSTGNTTGNHAGISIEHANSTVGPHWRISETTWKTGARLAANLHVVHGLGRPVAGKTLRKHSNFTATACPGPFMDSIWGQYVREAQRVYDRLTRKPKRLRIGSWNLALITKRPRLADRLRRIRKQVRKRNLDVLFTQERPQSPGKRLDGTLGHLTVRRGNKARYIYFRTGTKIHGAATWNPWPKNKAITKYVTTACATVPGDRKRFYVNCHAVSGGQRKKHRDRWAKAVIVKSERRARKHGLGPADIIYAGDFNGPEFAQRAIKRGYVRGRRWAKNQGRISRTFNAWGKRVRTHPGGQFSYFVVHKSMKKAIHRARTFWNRLASDHNLTILEIRE